MTHLVLAIGRVDLGSGQLLLTDGEDRALTTQDCALLAYLGARPNEDVPRDTLLTEVMGYAPSVTSRAVDDAMKRLRAKVERVPSRPFHLVSVRGVGYRFVPLHSNVDPNVVQLGSRRVDLGRLTVHGPDGEQTPLSSHEGSLLEVLLRHEGRPVKSADLLAEVWGIRDPSQRRVVNKLVYRLRAKIEDDPSDPHHLRTVRGRGLALDATARAAPRQQGGTPCPRPAVEVLGRDDLRARCAALLAVPGALVALHGPAGIGKSTLALAVADRWSGADRYADLEGVRDRDALLGALAAAVGADEDALESGSGLGAALTDSSDLLVVLDNAEASTDALQALLSDLRGTAPQVRWLIATRHLLGHPDAQIVEVGPLAHPDARRLFLERAADAGVQLDPDDPRLNHVVDEVNRIPLALDLAAGRLRLLGLDGLVSRLDEPLSVLARADDSEDSLARSLGRTWALLTPEDRSRLAACAALPGGLTPIAAERVLSAVAPGSALDGLQRLVDFAVVRRAHDGRLHPYLGVQEFARTRLGTDFSRVRDQAWSAYAAWLAEQGAGGHLFFGPAPARVARLVPEVPGALGALDRALPADQVARILSWVVPVLKMLGRPRQALRLLSSHRATCAEAPYATTRHLLAIELRLLGGHGRADVVSRRYEEGIARARDRDDVELYAVLLGQDLHRAAEVASQADNQARADAARALLDEFPPPRAEAHLRNALGWLAFRSGDLDTAWMELQDALSIARLEGDEWLACRLRYNLAGMCHAEGRLEEAEAFLEEVRLPYTQAGVPFAADDPDDLLGLIRLEQGRLHEAQQLHLRVLEQHRHTGNRGSVGIQANRLGTLCANLGDIDGATRWFEQARSAFQAMGATARMAGARFNFGKLALLRHDWDGAEAAFLEAHAVFDEMGRLVHTGLCLGGLAEVAWGRQQAEAAEEHAREGLDRLERGRATRYAADVRSLLAEIVSVRDPAEALPLAEDAVESLQAMGVHPLLGVALCRLALVQQRLGRHQDARATADLARATAEEAKTDPLTVQRLLKQLERADPGS